jgi:hypothetical protein
MDLLIAERIFNVVLVSLYILVVATAVFVFNSPNTGKKEKPYKAPEGYEEIDCHKEMKDAICFRKK